MASLQYINVGEGCRFCPDWIRVLTKLPDEDGTYLTCNLIGDTAYICMSHFYNGKFDTKDVTHWMPLPLPPNGRRTEWLNTIQKR